jgi:hypothetical protein
MSRRVSEPALGTLERKRFRGDFQPNNGEADIACDIEGEEEDKDSISSEDSLAGLASVTNKTNSMRRTSIRKGNDISHNLVSL